MKILITGATGFTARHLVRLLSTGPESAELYLSSQKVPPPDNAIHCKLGDEAAVRDLIRMVNPEQIYHLSGSFTNDYRMDHCANVLSSKHILSAVRTLDLNCRTLLIGSAAEYGLITAHDNPVPETHPLKPVGIYGLTKMFQTHLMEYFWRMYRSNVVMARPFNLIGKNMSSYLFVGKLYEQIEQYKRREIKHISVGNLDSQRDYINVEEAVRAYKLIMNYGSPGEIYNVGSGRSTKVADLLTDILSEHGMDIHVVKRVKLAGSLNKLDVPEIYADIRKLKTLDQVATRDF